MSAPAAGGGWRLAAGGWRLAVPYKMHGEDALMYPDLLLIRREPDRLRVDVIDPHGLHLEDALEKLQGLARFAQTHREGVLGRVMAIAEIDGRRCERDLSDPDIAQAALACLNDTDARRFFAPDRSPMAAVPYEPPLENRDDPSALTTRWLTVDRAHAGESAAPGLRGRDHHRRDGRAVGQLQALGRIPPRVPGAIRFLARAAGLSGAPSEGAVSASRA